MTLKYLSEIIYFCSFSNNKKPGSKFNLLNILLHRKTCKIISEIIFPDNNVSKLSANVDKDQFRKTCRGADCKRHQASSKEEHQHFPILLQQTKHPSDSHHDVCLAVGTKTTWNFTRHPCAHSVQISARKNRDTDFLFLHFEDVVQHRTVRHVNIGESRMSHPIVPS